MVNELALDELNLVGNLQIGRPNLGNTMRVSVFRLIFYSLRTVLEAKFGKLESGELIYQAGLLAGKTLAKNIISEEDTEADFVKKIKNLFLKSNIARLSVNKMDSKNKLFVFSMAEDLECSGLPNDGEKKCHFDAGFISGILSIYYKCEFTTKETGCWGTGEKFCTFKSMPK